MKRIYRTAGCVCLVSLALLSLSALNLRADDDKREEKKDNPQAAAAHAEKHVGIRVQMQENDGPVRTIVLSGDDAENGDGQAVVSGKVIIIGPDGKKREIDLTPGKGGTRPFQLQAMTGYMIGLQCISPDEEPSEEGQTGVTIAAVFPASPAEKAGIQKGDVLIKIGNKKVDKVANLVQAVQKAGKGKKALKLTLLRGDEEKTVEVNPVERKTIKMHPGMRVLSQLEGRHPELKELHKLFELKDHGNFSIDLDELGPRIITRVAPAQGNAEVEKLKKQVEKLTRQVKQLQKAVQELKDESEDE